MRARRQHGRRTDTRRQRDGQAPSRLRGVAMLEALVAMPLLLIVGLSVLQFGLLLHARQAVQHSALEAARSGAVGHAAPSAIEAGLARGLSPWLFGAQGADDHVQAQSNTLSHLRTARAAGWAAWRQLSPTSASFEDWAVPALDEAGRPLPDVLEIPTDNLLARSRRTEPRSGRLVPTSGQTGESAAVGAVSGQTLADANLLKIEFTYGVPLLVPLVGRLGAWVMRAVDGCEAATERRLAALSLGRPQSSASPRAWACPFYQSRESGGRIQPRWPVRVSATVRLQQPARHAGESPDALSLPDSPALGVGSVEDRSPPAGAASLPAGGRASALDNDRDSGFLRLGGTAPWLRQALCEAR